MRVVYGMSALEDAEMCLVNLQDYEAPSISVEARSWVQFMTVRGKFGSRHARMVGEVKFRLFLTVKSGVARALTADMSWP